MATCKGTSVEQAASDPSSLQTREPMRARRGFQRAGTQTRRATRGLSRTESWPASGQRTPLCLHGPDQRGQRGDACVFAAEEQYEAEA